MYWHKLSRQTIHQLGQVFRLRAREMISFSLPGDGFTDAGLV